MAKFIVPFDFLKVFGEKVLDIEAATVGDLLAELRERAGEEAWRRLSRAFLLVNGVAVNRLSGIKTPLSGQDEIWIVFPAGGG